MTQPLFNQIELIDCEFTVAFPSELDSTSRTAKPSFSASTQLMQRAPRLMWPFTPKTKGIDRATPAPSTTIMNLSEIPIADPD